MPNDVKAVVSIVVLIVAAILAYWSGSPIRHDFSTWVMLTAAFMVVMMISSLRLASGDRRRGSWV